jgi:hypothetical protein
MAQEEKKKEDTKMEEGKSDDKDKMKEEKDLPKGGGLSVNASLLGLGAGVLLVGGGLFAVRLVWQGRR